MYANAFPLDIQKRDRAKLEKLTMFGSPPPFPCSRVIVEATRPASARLELRGAGTRDAFPGLSLLNILLHSAFVSPLKASNSVLVRKAYICRQLDAPVLGQDHVFGLDVAVNQPFLSGVLERFGDRQRDPERFLFLEVMKK